MKLETSGQVFEKCTNTRFGENPSSGSRIVRCCLTDRLDMMELIVAFRSLGTCVKGRL